MPFAIAFTFFIGTSKNVDTDIKDLDNPVVYLDTERSGLGSAGIWIGFMIGMTHQICAYFWIILSEHWEAVV